MPYFRDINQVVMSDTKLQYETQSELMEAVRESRASQYIVAHKDNIDQPLKNDKDTQYIVSGKRSFEAAKNYHGKKVAVLNFANNHSVGGAPFYANAQEESLCRCSTLYPCLSALDYEFYKKHKYQYGRGEINYMGNDDLIYTPNVVVFKTDERTKPIYPQMLPRNEWYKVDIITSAAPELKNNGMPSNYEDIISSRIKKILDVAAKEKVEVLILGAWGCGAFANPSDVVARIFHKLLHNYAFEVVEFALATGDNAKDSVFAKEFSSEQKTYQSQIEQFSIKSNRNMPDFRDINREVMLDTKHQYETQSELKEAVRESIASQYIVAHEYKIDQPPQCDKDTQYIVSGKRSFEAAKNYHGKKVAVLNFANNHSVGGAPLYANAQEESLCRCSTLYPCLSALYNEFYKKHQDQYERRKINHMGNDDLIYTPNVVVFKTDERTMPIHPQMLPRNEWYKVDIITSAAPELKNKRMPSNYEDIISSRIKKILDVAAKEKVEVLILGAWGCGAFANPSDVVARIFHKLLHNYAFEVVEFALATGDNAKDSVFAKEFSSEQINYQSQIEQLLRSTGRENIEKVIDWLRESNFYAAPASVRYHNNLRGGLAKHSFEVLQEAMELNAAEKLPESSVILCSLLHDVCKHDQFYINDAGHPDSDQAKLKKGHGRRSMFILKRRCQLPLNYDEEMAIWWHMGEHEVSKNDYLREYEQSKNIPLCRLIQVADGKAVKSCN